MSDGNPVVTENGKMMAALSYGGFFIGFPLGFIPIVQRDDAFALYHAKPATAVWLVTFALGMVLVFFYIFISFVTCGLGAILVLPLFLLLGVWPMIVGVHGVVLAMNGQWEQPMGSFGLGDMLFGTIELKAPADIAALPRTAGQPPPVADEPPPVADEPPPVADEPPPAPDGPPPFPDEPPPTA